MPSVQAFIVIALVLMGVIAIVAIMQFIFWLDMRKLRKNLSSEWKRYEDEEL